MRYLHVVFAVIFAVSALLQYNDPDPLGWALIYLAAAGLAVAAFRGSRVWPLAFLLVVACLAWMATLLPGMAAFVERGDYSLLAATMKASDPMIEEAREFLGLGILLVYGLIAGTGNLIRPRYDKSQ